MRNDSDKICTVNQVIEKNILELQHNTEVTGLSFVAAVRQHYETTYPLYGRTLEFSTAHDPYARMSRDYEKFKYWLDPATNKPFPLELIESVIAAFPQPQRYRLQLELAERQGMMVFEKPDGVIDGADAGRLAKESGEALIALSEMIGSGKSRKKATEKALREVRDAIAALLSIECELTGGENLEAAPVIDFGMIRSR